MWSFKRLVSNTIHLPVQRKTEIFKKKSYKNIKIHCKFMGHDFDTFIKTTDNKSSSENSDRVCTYQ